MTPLQRALKAMRGLESNPAIDYENSVVNLTSMFEECVRDTLLQCANNCPFRKAQDETKKEDTPTAQ